MSKHLVASKRCTQCLMSKGKIVSDARRCQIIAKVKRDDCDFYCHKAQIAGKIVVCKGVLDSVGPGQMTRIAGRLNCIEYIETDTMEVVAP